VRRRAKVAPVHKTNLVIWMTEFSRSKRTGVLVAKETAPSGNRFNTKGDRPRRFVNQALVNRHLTCLLIPLGEAPLPIAPFDRDTFVPCR